MKRICFGTFIKVLLLCKDPLQNVKQHKFGQTLISSVNELHGQYVDETTISNYARCERSLASEITTATASANRDYVVDYFEKKIVPQLDIEIRMSRENSGFASLYLFLRKCWQICF